MAASPHFSYRGMKVCGKTAGFVKLALAHGYYQHVIAAYLNDNPGRVSETKTGKRHPEALPDPALPADFPLAA